MYFPWNNKTNATYQIKGINLRSDSDCLIQKFEVLAVSPLALPELSIDPTCVDPCYNITVNTSMQYDAYSLTFKVIAHATLPNVYESPNITINIGMNTSNHYAPIIPDFPKEIEVVSTQIKVYPISTIFDQDNDPNLIITDFVSNSSLFYYNENPREIRLSQTDPPTENGTYKVSFMVHDSRNLNTTYNLLITIKPPIQLFTIAPEDTSSVLEVTQSETLLDPAKAISNQTELLANSSVINETTKTAPLPELNKISTSHEDKSKEPEVLDEPINEDLANEKLSQMQSMSLEEISQIQPSVITEMTS